MKTRKRGTWLVNDFIEFLPSKNRYSLKIIIKATVATFSGGVVLATVSQIAQSLQCDLGFTLKDVTMLSAMFFFGEGIGSFYFGRISDTFGRKLCLIWTILVMVYFGILTAASPSLNFLLMTRFFTGAGYGGKVVMTFIYCTEFAKTTDRGLATLLYILTFTMGTLFAILMSYLTLNEYGWRFYVAVSNMVGIAIFPFFLDIPESMRYLQMRGRKIEIKQILEDMAAVNNLAWPSDAVLSTQTRSEKHEEKELWYAFRRYHWKIMKTCIVYLTIMFNFYGLPFFILYKLKFSDQCNFRMFDQDTHIVATKCTPLTDTEVLHSLYINSGTIPGAIISYFLAERFGRKALLNIAFLLYMLCFISQMICLPALVVYCLLFVCSGVTLAASCYVFTYISELFPTAVRATASGFVSAFGKMACIITPFVFQQLLQDNVMIVSIGISCLSFVALACLWFLPETLNEDME